MPAPLFFTVQRKIVYPNSVNLITDLGHIDMSAVSTIESFLQWGIYNYPAERYISIFWDHGGGPNRGFGGDETYDPPRATPISGIAQALQNLTNNNHMKFEIVGFDACLMGNAETASVLYPYTNYLLASEDLEPGPGWQYNTFLEYINTHPKATGADIGEQIISGYTQQNSDDPTTLSLLDSEQMPNLISAISDFSQVFMAYVNTSVMNWKQVARSRFKSYDYSTSVWDDGSYDLVDLYELAQKIALDFSSDSSLVLAANQLKTAIQNTVVHFENSDNRKESHGVTTYFPSILGQYDSNYINQTTVGGTQFFSTSYLNLISDYVAFYTNNKSSLVAEPTNFSFQNSQYAATPSNDFEEAYATVGSDTCSNLSFDNTYAQTFAGSCLSALQYQGVETIANDIVFDKANNTNSWPLLNGLPVLLIPDAMNPNTQGQESFLIPIAYSQATTGGYLVVERGADDQYKIVGFQRATGSNNTAGKLYDIEPLKTYIIKTYAEVNNRWYLVRNNDYSVTPPFVITFGALPLTNDFNAFRFIVADLTGALNVTNSSLPY